MTACKVCGGTDTVLWHQFIHEPKPRVYPEGMCYSGEVFCLCDRCMAEMIDTALSIRRAKDGMLMEGTKIPDCITRDCSRAAYCNGPPDLMFTPRPSESLPDSSSGEAGM